MPPAPVTSLTPSIVAAVALAACAPALDWRELRPAGTQLRLHFPCKPTLQERRVALAGRPVVLALHVCDAAGLTWGLAWADVGDPALVAAALAQLAGAAAANVRAQASRSAPAQVGGATPGPGNLQTWLQGTLPDDQPVAMRIVVFSHGTRVFQATALGRQLPDEAAETFFGALRIQP